MTHPRSSYPSVASIIPRLPKESFLAPSLVGTCCILAAIALAFVSYPASNTSVGMAGIAARIVGMGLVASFGLDFLQGGSRNLLRVDLLCLVGIYALTLAEFLFSQEEFEHMTNVFKTGLALKIVLLGIASLSIGRHLIKPKRMTSKLLTVDDLSDQSLFIICLVSTALAFSNMLLSVHFKVIGEDGLIYHMMGARFTQPWGRGRIGGISSLFTELAMMIYVIPPLTGVIVNRWRTFPKPQFILVLMFFSLTMFQGFSGGTRNVFVAYLATFIMGYLLTLKKNTIVNTILPMLFCVWLTGFASYHMLEFRTMGLRRYLENEVYNSASSRKTLAVDYNLASIGAVAQNMPSPYPFLGSEVIVWSIVRPLPRVFWKGKPEGLSVSVEQLAGAKGWTVAVTYLGEAYMTAGLPGVVMISLFLGALAAWWNRMAASSQSDYGLIVYALGFFAAGLTMRSMIWLTTAMLPVIALILFRKYTSLK